MTKFPDKTDGAMTLGYRSVYDEDRVSRNLAQAYVEGIRLDAQVRTANALERIANALAGHEDGMTGSLLELIADRMGPSA